METQNPDLTFDHRDEYLRRPIAEKVIRLLQSEAQVSPMAIDGGWGTGKTEFCHKLINLIKAGDSNCRAIYVDAFKADHADEPLLTLLAEVLRLVPETKRDGVIKKVLPAVRFGLKTGLKAGVSHLLRQDVADVVEDFEREVKQVADKSIDAAVETLLKDHVKANENLKALKDTLRELAKDAPIIIFIDELDRCRPDFAIAMLETIKHVFDVEGVKLVLIANTSQLRAAINHRYGSSIDAQRYLDKFLGFSFTLPAKISPNDDASILTSAAYYKLLVGKSAPLSDTKLCVEMALDLVTTLIQANQLSMREIETFVRHLEIYQELTEGRGLNHNMSAGDLVLRTFAVFLFSYSHECVQCLVHEKPIDAAKFAHLLGRYKLPNWSGETPYPKCADVLVAILGRESEINVSQYSVRRGEQEEAWNSLIDTYFSGSMWPPEEGERMSEMTKVINVLALSA